MREKLYLMLDRNFKNKIIEMKKIDEEQSSLRKDEVNKRKKEKKRMKNILRELER